MAPPKRHNDQPLARLRRRQARDEIYAAPGTSEPRKKPANSHLPQEPMESLESLIKQTSTLTLKDPHRQNGHLGSFVLYLWLWNCWRYIISPLILTAISSFVRLYGIGDAQSVVWDEAHFGKFGSYYIQHSFYFDVHPPLGKLLVGLSGYLAGFDGEFKFKSGTAFPEGPQFTYMRIFNAVFGILCTPLAYFSAMELDFSMLTCWLVGISVALEMLSLLLSRFILLDSMLMFFTASTFFGLVKMHTLSVSQTLISVRGAAWMVYLGLSIGCVCSVKLVGLFVTTLVGLYTIYDLLIKLYQTQIGEGKYQKFKMGYVKYLAHWAFRIVALIIIPVAVYLVSFMIHFKVLSKSGTGDGSISTLLQATLEGNTLQYGPRSVAYGSLVTFRSQGLSPNILHSHGHSYPEGSRQQQVTTYGYKDDNNDFIFEFDLKTCQEQNRFATLEYDPENPDIVLDYHTTIKDGDVVRISHKKTGKFLHTHSIAAAVLQNHYEVTCYGGMNIDDEKDDWVIEIKNQEKSPAPEFQDEDPTELHPISTSFRLRHNVLGCYLATTGYSYPAWGFQQGEVVCKKALLALEKSTWWNIENHKNDKLEMPNTTYVAPKPRFWKEFILLNYGMMASNNALVPNRDHHDSLSSEWWEWPILRLGLRMGPWSSELARYFLIGNVFVTYLSTICIPIAAITIIVTLLRGRRQNLDLDVMGSEWNFHLSGGILPFLGWVLHYLPFVIMARVTYLHHYVPAQYFGIFIYSYLIEYFCARSRFKVVKYLTFALAFGGVVGCFWYMHPFAMGMKGPRSKYDYLKLLKSWNF